MNVYDFDKTIYDGDSTVDFYLYCLKKQPGVIFSAVQQAYGMILYMFHRISKTALKEYFFSFLKHIPDSEAMVESFWKVHQSKIKFWYLEQKQSNDVIISASPEFLLKPICAQLHIADPIATNVIPQSGKICGQNCKGVEKVSRFREIYPYENVVQFYSDSKSDEPMANISQNAFLVDKNTIVPWRKEVKL